MPLRTTFHATAGRGRCAAKLRFGADSSKPGLTAPLGLMILLLWLAAPVLADQSTEADAETTPPVGATTKIQLPSIPQLDEKLKGVESAEAMDEALKASLSELYRRTRASLEEAAGFRAKRQELADFLESAPKQTKAIQLEIKRLQEAADSERSPQVSTKLAADEVSQRLNQVLGDATALENRVSELEKLLDEGQDRPTQDRARLIEVKQTLDEIDEGLRAPPTPGEAPELAEAKHWALEAQRRARWAESQMLEQDLLTQTVREAYYTAKRDQAALKLKSLRVQQAALEARLSALRKRQAAAAQEASEEAKRDAEDKPPLVREQILRNVEVSERLARITKELEGFNHELTQIDSERQRTEDDFRGAKQRIEAAGLSKALGQVLLDRRNQLPDLGRYRRAISEREDTIADATLSQIRYREELLELRDPKQYAQRLISSTEGEQAADPDLREALMKVLERRTDLLTQALRIEEDYIRQLGELNYASERVIQVAQSYDDFLAERLLWVRSAPMVGLETLRALPGAVVWLLSLDSWHNAWTTLAERARTSIAFWLGLTAVALLAWRLPGLRRAIRANAEPLRRVRSDKIRYTLQAIALTLLAALPIPLLLWVLGRQLQASPVAGGFTQILGGALCEVAFGLYYLLAFRMLCITGGVADRHFRWSSETLKRIRNSFDWLALYVVPISIVTISVYHSNDPTYVASLARLALIANLLGFAAFFYLLLHPSRGVLETYLQDHDDGWLHRLRHLWFPLVISGPLALAVLSFLGYVYTAGILFQSFVYQMWLALALIVLHQTIVRWLIVTRRRLALQAALERQAARRAHSEVERKDSGTTSEVLAVEEPEPDLARLDERTRRLINASILIGGAVGLWLTWSEVLPAFTFFDRFALWHYRGVVDGTEQQIPVTAADVGLVLLIGLVGTIAAKNVPALLEIVLLQTGSVSAGARYAIKTLASYSITAITALLAFSTLGLSWGQVQWLVAALGVGIGFGLQEIVANFISGIIILFERPVRVGDIVTIGDITGVVSNISIRATTIRNWDKQELLVPNKEFITGRLLNWSLTDQENRITIPVGVEYGTDTKKALALLAQVAEQHERVLAEPAPLISFEGFGDNALTLVLRCYLDSLDGRIGVISDIHQAIYDTYNAHGIAIAFPQRDVRLYTKQPLDLRLHSAQDHPNQESTDGADG